MLIISGKVQLQYLPECWWYDLSCGWISCLFCTL